MKLTTSKLRPVADIAKLAVAGMVESSQAWVDAGIGDGGELAGDELALEGRQHGQAVGLGSDALHIDPRLAPPVYRQQLAHRRLHRRQNRPFVQGHPLLDPLFHHRGKVSARSARKTRNGFRSNGRAPNRAS